MCFYCCYCLLNEKKKTLKYLVLGPGVRKDLSVIESYTRKQFKVMSKTNVNYYMFYTVRYSLQNLRLLS